MTRLLRAVFLGSTLALASPAFPLQAASWVRHGGDPQPFVWGIQGGLQFAIHPGGFGSDEGGPRGLLRIGYPTLTNSGYDLVNFIAIEPVVRGHRAFSELEPSGRDRRSGKRFEVLGRTGILTTNQGVEQLEVLLAIERFDNGAHIRLRLQQRSDAPNELVLITETEPDSAALDACILTATMGNKARTRLLWLREGPVSSLIQYQGFSGTDFAPHRVDALEHLPRLKNGDVQIQLTTDEETPSAVLPFSRPHFWDYRGSRVVQYWRKPADTVQPDLHCAVNARYTYYGTTRPIPGGVAYENFELRQRFREGDRFVFGVEPEAQSGKRPIPKH
jgi:hypothetical protein